MEFACQLCDKITILSLSYTAVVIRLMEFACQVFVIQAKIHHILPATYGSCHLTDQVCVSGLCHANSKRCDGMIIALNFLSHSNPPPQLCLKNYFLSPPLWRIQVKRFCTPRLREAVEAKRGVLPRFGSKYRYSGRTLYETRVNTEARPQPFFERTASKQYINNNRTQSMDDSESATLSTNIFFIDVVFMLAERSAALGLLGRDCICQVLVSTLYSGHSCFSSLRTDSWAKRVEFVCMR